jgi:hypothetical protein
MYGIKWRDENSAQRRLLLNSEGANKPWNTFPPWLLRLTRIRNVIENPNVPRDPGICRQVYFRDPGLSVVHVIVVGHYPIYKQCWPGVLLRLPRLLKKKMGFKNHAEAAAGGRRRSSSLLLECEILGSRRRGGGKGSAKSW